MKAILILLCVLVVAAILWQNLTMSYKIGYYEQTLKNNRDKFSPERLEQIENVMNKKSPF